MLTREQAEFLYDHFLNTEDVYVDDLFEQFPDYDWEALVREHREKERQEREARLAAMSPEDRERHERIAKFVDETLKSVYIPQMQKRLEQSSILLDKLNKR